MLKITLFCAIMPWIRTDFSGKLGVSIIPTYDIRISLSQCNYGYEITNCKGRNAPSCIILIASSTEIHKLIQKINQEGQARTCFTPVCTNRNNMKSNVASRVESVGILWFLCQEPNENVQTKKIQTKLNPWFYKQKIIAWTERFSPEAMFS
jgi:hypothetical protein